MTDKQIIIDDVDVNGCSLLIKKTKKEYECALYYDELNSDNEELNYGFQCSDNPNCYFKQLSRLTAQYNGIVEQNKSLQEECEELKSQLKTLDEEDVTYELTKEQYIDYRLLTSQYKGVVEQNESLQAELKARISECEDWRDKYYTSTTEVKADLMRQIEEKTAIIQGKDCKYSRCLKALEEIEKVALRYVEAQGRYEILDIINKAKGEVADEQ